MFRLFLVSLLLPLATLLVDPVHAASPRCFPETGYCVDGRFREYWEQNGELPVFGYPITAARDELQAGSTRPRLTQWFERARFELHPEHRRPYDVLLGRVGAERLGQLGYPEPARMPERRPRAGCLWFEATGYNVCDEPPGPGFKSYWRSHGLEFDGKPGTSYQESLALFGLPLGEPRREAGVQAGSILVQWFERARLEWHADRSVVLQGLLGAELAAAAAPYPAGSSGIVGDVVLGPVCPVEGVGAPCADRPYQATIRIEEDQTDRQVTQLTSDVDGRFVALLPPGDYRLVPLPPEAGPPPWAKPLVVTVPPGQFVRVLIRYDSGIR